MNLSVTSLLYKSLLLSSFLLTGCNWLQGRRNQQTHVIFITVESLNFEMASCLDDAEDTEDGFDELCREALRFTHFYSTNPMSQSALATLLTGLDSNEHKIFTNGNQGVPYTISTTAEKARARGFRTAFFSGGPPILAKSGLAQGFEDFDDDFISGGRLYKPARENFERVINNIEQFGSEKSFVGVFVPDLQFSYLTTVADDGKEREKSILGQKQEVGESLKWFFNELKEKKLWDNSYVIVLGLNGDASTSRKSVLWHENLFRENMNVPLFVKMPKAVELESTSFDSLVSMKHLGLLLQQVIVAKEPKQVMDYLAHWKDQAGQFVETETAWATWWFDLPMNLGVRTYDYLIFPRQNMRIYHTLVDKSESSPLSVHQVGKESSRWLQFRNEEPAQSILSINKDLYAFLEFLHTERQTRYSDFLLRLDSQKKNPFSRKVAADRAIKEKNWPYLQSYMETLSLNPACERLFQGKQKQRDYQRCKNSHQPSLFFSLIEWEKNFGKEENLFLEKTFIRQFRNHIRYKQTAYVSLFLELNWDVNVLDSIGPSLTELYLSQPSKAQLRKKIEEYKVPLYASFPQE